MKNHQWQRQPERRLRCRNFSLFLAIGTALILTVRVDGFLSHSPSPRAFTRTRRTSSTSPVSFLSQQEHHSPSLLHMVSTSTSQSQLYYRDLDASEEAFTDNYQPRSTTASHVAKEQQHEAAIAQQQEEDAADGGGGVSMPLIRGIWYNQGSIFLFATAMVVASCLFGSVGHYPTSFNLMEQLSSLHWNGPMVGGSPTPFHSLFDWQLTPLRVLEGIVATFPMIALGGLVEKSDHRDASHVNFSTTNMVISLFGRRRPRRTTHSKEQTNLSASEDTATTCASQVMWLSSAIALSTGISEEVVFRGYLPTAIATMTGSWPLAMGGQALLFALGHVSPKATAGENRVVGALQFTNALWYGMVYTMTGGDIVPCIIAHILYDMHVFCETWMSINHQMDYTERAYRQRLGTSEETAIQDIQRHAGPAVLNTETLQFARRFFYAFDSEHKGSLSLSDVQRAVSYAFLHQPKEEPTPDTVSDMFHHALDDREDVHYTVYVPMDRLTLSEFLRLLFALKSSSSSATTKVTTSRPNQATVTRGEVTPQH